MTVQGHFNQVNAAAIVPVLLQGMPRFVPPGLLLSTRLTFFLLLATHLRRHVLIIVVQDTVIPPVFVLQTLALPPTRIQAEPPYRSPGRPAVIRLPSHALLAPTLADL